MIVNKWDERETAKVYTHYIFYRTLIEIVHSNNGMLDMNIYPLIKSSVKFKIERLRRNYTILYAADNSEGEVANILRLGWPRVYDFMEFLENMHTYNMWNFTPEIYDAVQMECPENPNVIEYLLPEKLLEYSRKDIIITDEIVKELVTDMHNRIYTLVIKRHLPYGQYWFPY